MATGPVYCKSHVQKIVTLSSTESELVAMVEGVRRLIPLMGLLRKFGLVNESEPAVILCDNKSVLHLISNGEGCPGKSRHMRVRWHFISEMIESNYLRYEHIDTNLMVADILTKPMGGSKFRELRGIMMNCLVTDDDAEDLGESDDTLP